MGTKTSMPSSAPKCTILPSITIRATITATTRATSGGLNASSSATAISVPQTRSTSAAKLAILRGAAEITIAAEHAGAASSTGSTAASSNFDFWHNDEVSSTLSSAPASVFEGVLNLLLAKK